MKDWEKLYTDTCDNNRKVLQRLAEFIYNTVIAHGSSLNINNSIQYFIPLDDATISMYLHNDSHPFTFFKTYIRIIIIYWSQFFKQF